MKVLVVISLLLYALNVQAKTDDEAEEFWKIMWEGLEFIAGEVHLDPDTGLTINEFLDKYEYPVENHNVTTSDGYILTLQRVTQGKNNQIEELMADKVKPVVMFVPGLGCSSMDWVIKGPNISLALLLADLGYDVWLSNMRGSSHSTHQNYTRKDSAFWDYSFHEKGLYDVSASIDYILNLTTVDKITYVGHSEGTTDGLVLTSTRTEYNDKINLMVLLSPIVYMENLSGPLVKLLAQYENIIKLAMDILNVHGISNSPLISTIIDVFCNDDSSMQDVCVSILGLLVGFDTKELNKTEITVFFSNFPSGLSIKEMDHYLQEVSSGYFRQYDYGSIANFIHYGSTTPPSYDISKVTVPLAIYYAKNDLLSSVSDVEKFVYQLSDDTADRYLIEYELFNHFDFLMATNVKTYLYDRVIKVIQKYSPITNLKRW